MVSQLSSALSRKDPRHKALRKRRIFEAAVLLFSTKGFHGTTLEDIAEQVGVSKGTIYLYVKSKEELLDFAILEGFKVYLQDLRAKLEDEPDGCRKIAALADHQLACASRYEGALRAMLEEAVGVESRIERLLRRKRRRIYQIFEEVFAQAQAEGSLPSPFSPRQLASAFFNLTSVWAYRTWREQGFETAEIRRIVLSMMGMPLRGEA